MRVRTVSRRRAGRFAVVALVAAFATAAVSCVPPTPVHVVDVSNPPHGVIGGLVTSNHWRQIQTFTATRTGRLDQIDLWVQFAGPGPLLIDVHQVNGTYDIGTLVGLGSRVGTDTGEVAVPLSQPAAVVAGRRYAVSLRQAEPESSGSWQLSFSASDPLPGETMYVRHDDHPDVFPDPDYNLSLRTWVRSC